MSVNQNSKRLLKWTLIQEKSNIASTEKALNDSERELNYAKEDVARRTEFYNSETQRRNEDNLLMMNSLKCFLSMSLALHKFDQIY